MFLKTSPSKNLFGIFLFFLLVNTLLSYVPLATEPKLWILLFGFFLPLFLMIRSGVLLPFSERAPSDAEKGKVPVGIWSGIIVLAVAARLTFLRAFLEWPLYDEVVNGYYALSLERHWTWSPFFFWSQLPPFYIWALAFLFKIGSSALLAIRLLPVLLSLLILPLAYFAVRNLFSRSTSFLYLVFLSFGFWALYFGRLSHQGILLVLWEYLALFTLGKYLKTPAGIIRSLWLAATGLGVGTGFYTYFSWPAVALALSLPVFFSIAREKTASGKMKGALFFFVPLGLSLLPLLLTLFQGRYGHYFQFLWAFKSGRGAAELFHTVCLCLSGFLWGSNYPSFYYGPSWGGFFNPVAGSLLLLGLGVAWCRRRHVFYAWLLASLFLFFLPAFLSGPPVTEMREIQALPLLSFLAVEGIQALASLAPGKRRAVFLAVPLLVSSGLDLWHLQKTHQALEERWDFQKTKENLAAFQILEKTYAEKKEPGFVFTNFNSLVFHDYSLEVACRPFDAADLPEDAGRKAGWAAVVVNAHYQPFLSRRFPRGRWYWLSKGLDPRLNNYNGGLMLGVVPLGPESEKAVEDWRRADAALGVLVRQIMDLSPDPARKKAIRLIQALGPSLPSDPLVQSCYWDMVFTLYDWENMYGDKDAAKNFPASLQAIQNALRTGYPAAHFYNELGSLYLLEKKYGLAEAAFRQALKAPLNLTPAGENLKVLEEMKKGELKKD